MGGERVQCAVLPAPEACQTILHMKGNISGVLLEETAH